MTGTKTVVERLREITPRDLACKADVARLAIEGVPAVCLDEPCIQCTIKWVGRLADAIEAEQAKRDKRIEMLESDQDDYIEHIATFASWQMEIANMLNIPLTEINCSGEVHSKIIAALKDANASKPQLPEGVIWPTYEDGELVKFGDKFMYDSDIVDEVRVFHFYDDEFYLNCSLKCNYDKPLKRPEPEVLDADNVPIKVGDTVWYEGDRECVVERIYRQNGDTLLELDVCGAVWNMANVKPAEVTHRKPDTQVAIDNDTALPPWEYCERYGIEVAPGTDESDTVEAMCRHLLERQRNLLVGE